MQFCHFRNQSKEQPILILVLSCVFLFLFLLSCVLAKKGAWVPDILCWAYLSFLWDPTYIVPVHAMCKLKPALGVREYGKRAKNQNYYQQAICLLIIVNNARVEADILVFLCSSCPLKPTFWFFLARLVPIKDDILVFLCSSTGTMCLCSWSPRSQRTKK